MEKTELTDIVSEIVDITFLKDSSAHSLFSGESAKVYATRRGEAAEWLDEGGCKEYREQEDAETAKGEKR